MIFQLSSPHVLCTLILFTWMGSIAPPVDGADTVRVMSFNIRYGTARDGDDVWPNRKELVAETINQFKPDLLGTQETLPFQAAYLLERLPGYTSVGWSRDASKDGEQCTIYFRSARFELLDKGQFWLSETPDEQFSKSWDSSLPRVATWVKLRSRVAGEGDLGWGRCARRNNRRRGADAA